MNTKGKIRLAALDLDGTALRSDGTLSDYSKRMLERAKRAGIHIAAASGRAYASLPEELLAMECVEYAVTSNGAAVCETRTGRRLRECRLKREAVRALIMIGREAGVTAEGFVDGVPYAERSYVENPVHFGASLYSVPYVKRTRRPVEDIYAFLWEHGDELDSLDLIVGDARTKAELRRRILSEAPGVYLTSSVPTLLEASDERAGKAAGLSFLAGYLGVAQEETVAFGNEENDVDMMRWAGIGVAVENAPAGVRAAADQITGTNDADGVGMWLERYLDARGV